MLSGLQKPFLEDKGMIEKKPCDDMNTDEKLELLKQEKIVRDGKDTFVRVGCALAVIQFKRLYRQQYPNFSNYCEKKWGFTRQYAHDLIKGAAAVQALPKDLSTIVDNAGAATALAEVPAEQQASVVRKIKKSKKPATAAAITQTAAEVAKPRAEKPVAKVLEKDEIGYDIPEGIMLIWNRRDEVKELQKAISKVKCHVENALAKNDALFAELDVLFTSEVKSIYTKISMALPYCVCPQCNGRDFKNCVLCKGRGFISKYKWENAIDEKTRNFRLAVIRTKK
jgi:hypothetical protein